MIVNLERLECLLNSAAAVASALQALRDSTTEEEWDVLNDSGALSTLLDACSDLEADLDD